MARAKSKGRFNDVVWINWALTIEQKKEIKAWQPDVEELDDMEAEIIQEGNKVTLSWDDYGQCYTCSIVPTSSHKTNQGYILTGKGSLPFKAKKQAFYIHKQVFGTDWSSYSTARGVENLDD